MHRRLWPPLLALGLFLSGCGSDSEGCASQAPPAIEVRVGAYGATSGQLCDAQVVAYDSEGYIEYVEGVMASASEPEPGCRYLFAHHRFATYSVDLKVQGFEPLTIAAIEFVDDQDSCSSDSVYLSATLTGSTEVCHEGYEWLDDACQTPNGCRFPLFEQQMIPGVQGAEIYYECVAACATAAATGYVLPEAPGRCEALALP